MIEGSITVVFVREHDATRALPSPVVDHIDDRADLEWYTLKGESLDDRKRRFWGSLSGVVRVDDAPTLRQLYETERPLVRLKILADNLVDTDGEQAFTATLELVQTIYDLTGPEYVFGHSDAELDYFGVDNVDWGGLDHPIDEEALAAHQVAQPMWLMLLPPAMVETYGREWLHDLPADRVEDLDDGAVLVVGVEDFTDCDSEIEFGQRIDEARFALEDAFEDAPVS